jgi:two-component system NtrC family response regulator
MADDRRITDEDLELADGKAPSGVSDNSPFPGGGDLKEAREQIERKMVCAALDGHSGNISAAAKGLGISRPTLYELMNKLGISK